MNLHYNSVCPVSLLLFFSHKMQDSTLKRGTVTVEKRRNALNPHGWLSERGKKPPLPSFKVPKLMLP